MTAAGGDLLRTRPMSDRLLFPRLTKQSAQEALIHERRAPNVRQAGRVDVSEDLQTRLPGLRSPSAARGGAMRSHAADTDRHQEMKAKPLIAIQAIGKSV